jgi:3-methyladenine DNA glycosylase AlkD
MTLKTIVNELQALGTESIRKVLRNHGAPEPLFGVKIGDMKPIQKQIKQDYQLALDLYDTGIYDAMYLAGLIADDARMTEKDLDRWAQRAPIPLASSTVAWVAAGSRHGRTCALRWIDADEEHVAVAGWSTLASLVTITNDAELDLAELERLLQRVQKTIHHAPNFVRSAMNGFVIALGTYVPALSDQAVRAANAIGRVAVDHGNTACEVPFAPDVIQKAREGGRVGKKRKSAKC